MSGEVALRLTVNKAGKVVSFEIVSARPSGWGKGFASMAIDAAKQSEFLCASCSGNTFPAHGYVSIPVSNYSEGRLHSAISPASGIQSMRNLFIAFKLMGGYAEKNICEGIVLPTMNIPDKKWFTEEQMKHVIGEANERPRLYSCNRWR
jgi:hypothetical protein